MDTSSKHGLPHVLPLLRRFDRGCVFGDREFSDWHVWETREGYDFDFDLRSRAALSATLSTSSGHGWVSPAQPGELPAQPTRRPRLQPTSCSTKPRRFPIPNDISVLLIPIDEWRRATYLLISDTLGCVTHELLDHIQVHGFVNLLQYRTALLQSIQDILLDQRELDRRHLRHQNINTS